MIENLVLDDDSFVKFQMFCDRRGFYLRYCGPEMQGSEEKLKKHRFDNPNKVVRLKKRQFSCKGIPYDVAEWQEKEWNSALPDLKAEFFTWKSSARSHSAANSQVNALEDVSKQLVDQLKAVIVAGLLLLTLPKLITGDVIPNKVSVFNWAIGSLVMLIILYLMSRTTRFRWSKRRWIFLVVAFGLFWLLYLLNGVYLPYGFTTLVAIILILWSSPLVVALGFIMLRLLPQGKPEHLVRTFAKLGDPILSQLSPSLFLVSILTNWAKVRNSGITDWWVDVLLFWGILIYFVVVAYQFRRINVR